MRTSFKIFCYLMIGWLVVFTLANQCSSQAINMFAMMDRTRYPPDIFKQNPPPPINSLPIQSNYSIIDNRHIQMAGTPRFLFFGKHLGLQVIFEAGSYLSDASEVRWTTGTDTLQQTINSIAPNQNVIVDACSGEWHVALLVMDAMKPHDYPKLLGYGNNTKGALGSMNQATLDEIDTTSVPDVIDRLYCGRSQTYVRDKSGTMYGIGDNTLTQLGKATGDIYVSFQHIDENAVLSQFDWLSVRTVSCMDHCLIATTTKIYGWGENNLQQLIDVNTAPQQLIQLIHSNLEDIVMVNVAVTKGASFLLYQYQGSHGIYAWGRGAKTESYNSGTLGDPTSPSFDTYFLPIEEEVRFGLGENFIAVENLDLSSDNHITLSIVQPLRTNQNPGDEDGILGNELPTSSSANTDVWLPLHMKRIYPKRTWGMDAALFFWETEIQCNNVTEKDSNVCKGRGYCSNHGNCMCNPGDVPVYDGCVLDCPYDCGPNIGCYGPGLCGPGGSMVEAKQSTFYRMKSGSYDTLGGSYSMGEMHGQIHELAVFKRYIFAATPFEVFTLYPETEYTDEGCGLSSCIPVDTQAERISGLENPIRLCTGENHVAFFTAQKEILVMGTSEALGTKYGNTLLEPEVLFHTTSDPFGSKMLDLYCGTNQIYVKTYGAHPYDISFFGWGSNQYSALASPTSTPSFVETDDHIIHHFSMGNMTSFSCTHYTCVYITNEENGRIFGWGKNDQYQLALDGTDKDNVFLIHQFNHKLDHVGATENFIFVTFNGKILVNGEESYFGSNTGSFSWNENFQVEHVLDFMIIRDAVYLFYLDTGYPTVTFFGTESIQFLGINPNEKAMGGTPASGSTFGSILEGSPTIPRNLYDQFAYVIATSPHELSSVPMCFGKSAGLDSTCGHFGKCIGQDTCKCIEGFHGKRCENIGHQGGGGGGDGDGGAVCRMNATISPSSPEAICNDHRFGTCFGTAFGDPNVCSGKGACVPPACQCEHGLNGPGPACAENTFPVTCFGEPQGSTNACSGNGICGPYSDDCDCNPGWEGEDCSVQVHHCFGKPSYDACSGNGECVAQDTCQCIPGASGTECEIFSATCNNGGQAVGPGKCLCEAPFVGPSCSSTYMHFRASGNIPAREYGYQGVFYDMASSSQMELLSDPIFAGDHIRKVASARHGYGYITKEGYFFFSGGFIGNGIGTMPPPYPNLATIDEAKSINGFSYKYLFKAMDIAMGERHCLLLTIDGQLLAFGSDEDGNGHLGINNMNVMVPHIIALDTSNVNNPIRRIFAGADTNYVITDTLDLFSMGNDQVGQLGRDTTGIIHTNFGKVMGIVNLFSCNYHSCVAYDGWNKLIKVWGSNNDYQLGVGDTGTHNRMLPTDADIPLITVTSIATGSSFTMITDDNGNMYMAGRDVATGQHRKSFTVFNIANAPAVPYQLAAGVDSAFAIGYSNSEPVVFSAGQQNVGELGQDVTGFQNRGWGPAKVAFSDTPYKMTVVPGGYDFILIVDEQTCNGIGSSQPLVCSAHGICVGNDVCECDPNYSGQYCDTYNRPSGMCDGGEYGVCTCTGSPTVYYPSSEGCPGSGTCPNNCNNHGTCNSGTCVCSNDPNLGYWQGTDCSQCASGYSGPDCNFKADLKFSPDGYMLEGIFIAPQRPQGFFYVDCAEVFPISSLEELGDGPYCEWTGNGDEFIVYLGPGSTLLPGVLPMFTYPDYNIFNANITSGNLPPPTAVIDSISSIGACDELVLDGTQSYSLDGRVLTYHWNLVSPSKPSINTYLSQQDSAYVIVPTDLLNGTYGPIVVSLKVSSIMSGESALVSKTIQILQAALPSATVYPVNAYDTRGYEIIFTADPYSCVGKQMIIQWEPIGHSFVGVPYLDGRKYRIPPYTFPVGSETSYKYRVKISHQDNSGMIERNVTATIFAASLDAVIKGGDRIINIDKQFSLDGSEYIDPDNTNETPTYSWSCFTSDYTASCPAGFPSSGPVITIPSGYFTSAEEYVISLSLTKGSRSAIAFTYITIVNYNPPSLFLYPIPPVSPRDLPIFVSARLDGSISDDETYQWNVTENGVNVNLDNIAITQTNRRELGVKENAFAFNATIVFTLTATNSQGTSTAKVTTKTNTLPNLGTVSVSPSSGKALSTEFVVSVSENANLKYVFGYYDGTFRIPLSAPTSATQFKMIMPFAGNISIFVTGFDKYYSRVTKKIVVSVTEPTVDIASYATNITSSLDSSDIDTLYSQATNIGNMLAKEYEDIDIGFTGCPNDCSGNGDCFDGICECYQGYYKADCSIDEQQQGQRKELRTNLLSKLVESRTNDISSSFDIGVFEQRASLIGSITQSTDEMSEESETLAATFIDGLLNDTESNSVALTDSSSEIIGRALSNVLKSSFSRANNVNSKQAAATTASNVRKNVDKLMKNIRSKVVAGTTKTVVLETLTIVTTKVDVKDLTKSSVGTTDGKVKVNLSPDILTTGGYSSQAEQSNGLEVSIVALKINPYIYDNFSSNIKSEVIQLDFSIGGNKILVNNLANPLSLSIPGSYQNLTTDENEAGYRAFCTFWNETTASFSQEGCRVVSSTQNETKCACNHATDFASFLSYVTPNLNLINVDDLKLITQLNQDNFVTLFFMLGLACTYFLGMVFLEGLQAFGKTCYHLVRNENIHRHVNPSDVHSRGVARPLIERFKRSHIWISLFYTPNSEPNFTRSRRLTILYMLIIGIMGSNALTFGQKQENELQMIASIIVCDLIVTPPIILFTFIFGKISSNWKNKVRLTVTYQQDSIAWDALKADSASGDAKKSKDKVQSTRIQQFIDHDDIKEKELDEMDDSHEISTQGEKPECDSSESNENDNLQSQSSENKLFFDNPLYEDDVASKNSSQQDPWGVMETDAAVCGLVEKLDGDKMDTNDNAWDHLDRHSTAIVEQYHLSHKQETYENNAFDEKDEFHENNDGIYVEDMKFMDLYHFKTGQVLDNVDNFLLGFKRHFDYHTRTVTALSLLIFAVASVLWFCLVALAAYLSTNIHWMTRVGIVAMTTGGIVLYIIALEYLIINAKRNHFQRNPSMKWISRLSRNIQVILGIILILLIFAIEILLTLTAGKTIYGFSYDIGIENMIILQIGFGAFLICDAVWIFLLIRPPKRKSKPEWEKIRRFGTTWLPSAFKYPVYFACWSWIAGLSYVLVIYGIKFSEIEKGQDINWIISSFSSMGQNIFINKPSSFVLRAMVFIMVMDLFEELFFKVTLRSKKNSQPAA